MKVSWISLFQASASARTRPTPSGSCSASLLSAPLGEAAGRLALEVDEVEVVLHDQDLAQMQIPMDARLQRRDRPLGQRLDAVEAFGAPRQQLLQNRAIGLADDGLSPLQGIEG